MISNANQILLVLCWTMITCRCSSVQEYSNNILHRGYPVQILHDDPKGLKSKMNVVITDKHDAREISRTYMENPFAAGSGDGVSRRRQKMSRMLIVMLMAYTLKFIFLIPTMIGGWVILKFTILLAGFFYSLFAATLGLKARKFISV